MPGLENTTMKMGNLKRTAFFAAGPMALAVCVMGASGAAFAEGRYGAQDASAQAPPPPASSVTSDAQIEANVVRALAGSKTLAADNITTTAVFGKVTLSGVVTDEASKELAGTLASGAPGVKTVINNLTIGTPSVGNATAGDNSGPDPAAGNVAQAPPQQGGSQGEPAGPQLGPQIAGQKVVVQGGAALYVRIMEQLDSKHVRAGTPFQGTVLNDVIADNTVAIPRGATVSGVVVEAKHPGFWSGVGSLVLQGQSVQMMGQTIPITTYMWGAPNAKAFLPAEAIVRLRFERPAAVVTVSQDDLAKLAASVPLLKGVPPENNARARKRYGTANADPGYTDEDDY